MSEKPLSAEFPFASEYIEVYGARMHYIDEGDGDPVLFLHGNPTSSYLWRNIIPYMTPLARCVAPDLMGMGKSDKPAIGYRFHDHARYVDGFIEQLGLTNITLVLHDWGSGLGFHYAARHAENIKAIAFMEALVKPVRWDDFPPDFKMGFRLMRTPWIGWFMISVANMFVTQILPQAVVRPLSEEEMAHYREPFQTIASRKPVRQWPCEIPIDGTPQDVQAAVSEYSRWLQDSKVSKLLFYGTPGALIDARGLAWCKEHLANLETVDIGRGIHFLQEDNPHLIGAELARWYQTL